ncbi:DUF4191 domain-containing protein [Aquipuribacter hungaricus]|uniref:DUF4191 domain-containing protein n=1 Tax=Aquipuribacter hungaricus TaxID=545624 RepID=A0ABV7WE17_9MICO
MARTGSSAASDAAPAKKQGRLRQFAAVYRMTAQYDRPAPLWVLGSALLVLLVGLGLTFLLADGLFSRILGSISSVLAAVLVGLVVLTRRADKALFAQVDGRQGATAIVMQQLRRGWVTSEEPVGADPRTKDLVFRAVGRPGIVLLVEGPLPRTFRLADGEKKRHTRVASGVPVHVIHVGNGEGQVPLRKVSRRMMRLPRTLTPSEVSAVAKRMQALGGLRASVPKGIDPTRARASRGR